MAASARDVWVSIGKGQGAIIDIYVTQSKDLCFGRGRWIHNWLGMAQENILPEHEKERSSRKGSKSILTVTR
jgi:hypothetical protein